MSETLLELHTFQELEVETSIEACVQSVSRSALHHVMRDAHERLRRGLYLLFP